MLWRVRTTLPDRPGALAALAHACGAAGVNILALQIFPGVGAVTDELVLRTPGDWDAARVAALVEVAGGDDVEVGACTEVALGDQPTRYVQAARAVVADPLAFPEVVGRLLDAEGQGHVMEVSVGDVSMQVYRGTAFTAVEQARGAALADLVSDVLGRGPDARPHDGRRLGAGVDVEHVVSGSDVTASIGGVVVGLASVEPADDPASRGVRLRVDPAWRRRGIGTRLLADVARLARAMGAEEVVLTTGAGNPAVLPMVMAAGLRGRIKVSGEELVVRAAVTGLSPLPR